MMQVEVAFPVGTATTKVQIEEKGVFLAESILKCKFIQFIFQIGLDGTLSPIVAPAMGDSVYGESLRMELSGVVSGCKRQDTVFQSLPSRDTTSHRAARALRTAQDSAWAVAVGKSLATLVQTVKFWWSYV